MESEEPEAFPRTEIERGICWIMKPRQALSCVNVTRMLELSQIFNNLVMNSSLGSISAYSTFDIQLNIVRHPGMIPRNEDERVSQGFSIKKTFLSTCFSSASVVGQIFSYNVGLKIVTSVNNCLLSAIKCCGLLVHVNIKPESSISLYCL